jgi:type IV fimbrial biogenesis protein FimT
MKRKRVQAAPGRSSGLSLVEPMFAEVTARLSVSAAASSWRDVHALGRSHAILRRVPTVLCPSADGETCDATQAWEGGYLLFEDSNRNRRREATERVIRVFTQQPRIRMTTSIGRRTVTFQPSGRTDGSNLTMTICSRSAVTLDGRRLITSNSGRTRSETIQCGA